MPKSSGLFEKIENSKLRTKILVTLLILSISSSVILSVLIFSPLFDDLKTTILENQVTQLDFYEILLVNKLIYIDKILLAIANNPDVFSLLNFSNHDDPKFLNLKNSLEHTFISFMVDDFSISQIRILDTHGVEIIRVQSSDSGPVIVPDDKLQDKSNRYYFTETALLSANEIFTSEMDLNVEFDKIVVPFEPTVRKATPIFDNNENFLGILIINLNYSNDLNSLKTVKDGHAYLVNESGYYLFNQDPSQIFGNILGTDANYFTEFPDFPNHLKIQDYDVDFNSNEGDFVVWKKIFYDQFHPQRYWILVNDIPEETIFASLSYLWIILLVSLCVGSLIIFGISRKISNKIIGPLEVLTKFSEEITLENLDKKIKMNRGDEIGKLADSFNHMIASLNESNLKKKEFTAMMTHELKTPLTPVIGYCQMLLSDRWGSLTDKQRQSIKEIQKNSENLLQLIDDLLDAKILDLNKMEFEENTIHLPTFLNSIQQYFSNYSSEKNIDFIVSCQTDLTIQSDEKRLTQVFEKLIKNSMDFVPNNNAIIEFGAEESDGKIKFHVKDNGTGIPKDKIEHIFKKFYQVDTSLTRRHGGTGLGLVICQGIVEGLGGKIWVESQIGKGTIFYFTIPFNG